MPQADVAVREINEIRAAYTPNSQTYKFQVGILRRSSWPDYLDSQETLRVTEQEDGGTKRKDAIDMNPFVCLSLQHLFLNVVENPSSRVKPANVDEIRWRQVLAQAGGPDNPDK